MPCKLLAHRGASKRAPENTLAAFRAAIELGVDGCEFDVRLCASGEIVVIHDDDLKRLAGAQGRVSTSAWAELRQMDVGRHFAENFRGEGIPLLGQVTEIFDDRHLLNIEMKADAPEQRGLPRALGEWLRKNPPRAQVLVSSFDPLALWRFKRAFPEFDIGYLYAPDQPWFLRRGLPRFFLRPRALNPHHSLVSEAFVRRAHRQGRMIATWTVDDPAVYRRLQGWGVDVVISNTPDKLR